MTYTSITFGAMIIEIDMKIRLLQKMVFEINLAICIIVLCCNFYLGNINEIIKNRSGQTASKHLNTDQNLVIHYVKAFISSNVFPQLFT